MPFERGLRCDICRTQPSCVVDDRVLCPTHARSRWNAQAFIVDTVARTEEAAKWDLRNPPKDEFAEIQ